MNSKLIIVAFTPEHIAEGWTGGLNYLTNLLRTILSKDDRSIEPILFIGKKIDNNLIPDIQGLKIIETSLFDRYSPLWVIRHLILKLISKDILLYRLLMKNEVSVLSHSKCLWNASSVKTICWIPDFQHVHYPQFFSSAEIESRDNNVNNNIEHGSHIVLSSHCAQKDLAKFDGNYLNTSSVLRFVANVDFDNLPDKKSLGIKYGFTENYVYVPAQFWEHKNHKVIINALKEIKKAGRHVKTLCTGDKNDYRNPHYYSQLMKSVELNNLQDDFIILGIVPYSDVIGLMFYSKAVINPSLFEGWSTVVEECKLLNKYLILSDIPVHREQAPDIGDYFAVDDHIRLADLMVESMSRAENNCSLDMLKNNMVIKRNAYAKCYEDIVMKSLSKMTEN